MGTRFFWQNVAILQGAFNEKCRSEINNLFILVEFHIIIINSRTNLANTHNSVLVAWQNPSIPLNFSISLPFLLVHRKKVKKTAWFAVRNWFTSSYKSLAHFATLIEGFCLELTCVYNAEWNASTADCSLTQAE